ncbi:MAG: nitroreductase [Frankiales bacterium]|nr:nitroreductase [Frankiales bacterium]
MPSDFQMKAMNAVHRTALKVTGGKVGWTLIGMPVIELTTTGRKSGLPRTVMLTSPHQEGLMHVVVASRGGDDKPPAWLGNIVAEPRVQVAMGGEAAQPWTARVASPEERARLWPVLSSKHKNYAAYQRKTEREIPLVLLEPVS